MESTKNFAFCSSYQYNVPTLLNHAKHDNPQSRGHLGIPLIFKEEPGGGNHKVEGGSCKTKSYLAFTLTFSFLKTEQPGGKMQFDWLQWNALGHPYMVIPLYLPPGQLCLCVEPWESLPISRQLIITRPNYCIMNVILIIPIHLLSWHLCTTYFLESNILKY